MSALPSSRQAAAMTKAAIRSHFHQALDIHRGFFAKVAFNRALAFDEVAEVVDLLFRQIANLLIRVHLSPVKERKRTGPPDAIYRSARWLPAFWLVSQFLQYAPYALPLINLAAAYAWDSCK